MLSRFARPAALRRAVRGFSRSARCFSTFTESMTHSEVVRELEDQGLDPDQTVIVKEAGENAYSIVPATQEELVAHLSQLAVEHDLNDEDADEGFLEAIGLGPFHRKATLLATGAITAISNEVYVMNEETIVALCLAAGFTTMHVLLREPILAAYEEFQQDTLKAQTDAEAKHIAACETLINSQTGSESIVDAVRTAFTEKEELVHAEAAARAIQEKNRVAKEFDGRLQALVNRKADEENKAYKALIDAVYADVIDTVTTDKKFQKAALKYALTAISTPKKAGANPTVTLYEEKLTQ